MEASTALAPTAQAEVEVLDERGIFDLLHTLEETGAISLRDTVVDGERLGPGFSVTDPGLPFDHWKALGRFFGGIERGSRWLLGDWLRFGFDVYGDDEVAAEAEPTVRERYDEAERLTGLDHGTLLNIASICKRVARRQRREALGFWIHAEVAPFEDPEEQERWLALAVENGWTRSELRKAIRGEDAPAPPDDGGTGDGDSGRMTVREQQEAALRLVWNTGQKLNDHIELPLETWAQVGAALGEEEA